MAQGSLMVALSALRNRLIVFSWFRKRKQPKEWRVIIWAVDVPLVYDLTDVEYAAFNKTKLPPFHSVMSQTRLNPDGR